jgi:hypothetical protein
MLLHGAVDEHGMRMDVRVDPGTGLVAEVGPELPPQAGEAVEDLTGFRLLPAPAEPHAHLDKALTSHRRVAVHPGRTDRDLDVRLPRQRLGDRGRGRSGGLGIVAGAAPHEHQPRTEVRRGRGHRAGGPDAVARRRGPGQMVVRDGRHATQERLGQARGRGGVRRLVVDPDGCVRGRHARQPVPHRHAPVPGSVRKAVCSRWWCALTSPGVTTQPDASSSTAPSTEDSTTTPSPQTTAPPGTSSIPSHTSSAPRTISTRAVIAPTRCRRATFTPECGGKLALLPSRTARCDAAATRST